MKFRLCGTLYIDREDAIALPTNPVDDGFTVAKFVGPELHNVIHRCVVRRGQALRNEFLVGQVASIEHIDGV